MRPDKPVESGAAQVFSTFAPVYSNSRLVFSNLDPSNGLLMVYL